MSSKQKASSVSNANFKQALGIHLLIALMGELKLLRDHPPLTRHLDGHYEGQILGFVRGLRLSAGVIYFLRERLSATNLEVAWGHLVDDARDSCSPECDVIVHKKGHVAKWNGTEDPVMVFKFVKASSARAIVSCKSKLTDIDKSYPKSLKKYGVADIFLFAECCQENDFPKLEKAAKKAGYRGLWCLYLTDKDSPSFRTDEKMLINFGDAVHKAVSR